MAALYQHNPQHAKVRFNAPAVDHSPKAPHKLLSFVVYLISIPLFVMFCVWMAYLIDYGLKHGL